MGIQRRIGVGEPLGAGVIEVRQGSLAEFRRGFLVAGGGQVSPAIRPIRAG